MPMKRGLLLPSLILGASSQAATTIAVDVGHYLEQPGVSSARGEAEFGFNRELALKIGDALKSRGFEVRLVGEHGMMKDLRARTHAARKDDFFLSVHHDSAQPKYLSTWTYEGNEHPYSDRFSGFSLFISRKNANPTASLQCASALGKAMIEAGFKPSRHHAEPIPGENRPFADEANGVHYYDDLVVLKTARQPAVLLEAGVIVNREDELVLKEPATREKIAGAVADALAGCLKASQTDEESSGKAPGSFPDNQEP